MSSNERLSIYPDGESDILLTDYSTEEDDDFKGSSSDSSSDEYKPSPLNKKHENFTAGDINDSDGFDKISQSNSDSDTITSSSVHNDDDSIDRAQNIHGKTQDRKRRRKQSIYSNDQYSDSDENGDGSFGSNKDLSNPISDSLPPPFLTDQDIKSYFESDMLYSVRNNPNATPQEIRKALRQSYPIFNMAHSLTMHIDDEFQQDLATHLYSCHLSKRKNIVKFPQQWTNWPFRPDLEDGPEDLLPLDEDDARDINDRLQRVEGLGWKDPNNHNLDLNAAVNGTVEYGEEEHGVNYMPSTKRRREIRRILTQTDPFDIAQRDGKQNGMKKDTNTHDSISLSSEHDQNVEISVQTTADEPLPLKKFTSSNILMSNLEDITQIAPGLTNGHSSSTFAAGNNSNNNSDFYSARKNFGRKNLDFIPPHNSTDIYTDPDNPQGLPYARIATGTSTLPKNLWKYRISDSMSAYEDLEKRRQEYKYDPLTGDIDRSDMKKLNPDIGLPRDSLSEVEEKRLAHARQLMLFELNALFQRQVYDKIQVMKAQAREEKENSKKSNRRNKRRKLDEDAKNKQNISILDTKRVNQFIPDANHIDAKGIHVTRQFANFFDPNFSQNSQPEKLKAYTDAVPSVSSNAPELPLQVREKLLDLLDNILIQVGYATHISSGSNIYDTKPSANTQSLNKTASQNASASSDSKKEDTAANILKKHMTTNRAGNNLFSWAEVLANSGAASIGNVYERCHQLFYKDIKDPRASGKDNKPVTINNAQELQEEMKNILRKQRHESNEETETSNKPKGIDEVLDEDGYPIYDLYYYLFPNDYVTPDPELVTKKDSSIPDPSSPAEYVIRGNVSAVQMQTLHMGTRFIDPGAQFGNSRDPVSQYKSILADAYAIPGEGTGLFMDNNQGRRSGMSDRDDHGNKSTGPRLNKSSPDAQDYLLGAYGLGKEFFEPAARYNGDIENKVNDDHDETNEGRDDENDDSNDIHCMTSSFSKVSGFDKLFKSCKTRAAVRRKLVNKLRKCHILQTVDQDLVKQNKRLRGLRNNIAFRNAIWRKVPSVTKQGLDIGQSAQTQAQNDTKPFKIRPDWVMPNDYLSYISKNSPENADLRTVAKMYKKQGVLVPGWLTGSQRFYTGYLREGLRQLENKPLPFGLPKTMDGIDEAILDQQDDHMKNSEFKERLVEWGMLDKTRSAAKSFRKYAIKNARISNGFENTHNSTRPEIGNGGLEDNGELPVSVISSLSVTSSINAIEPVEDVDFSNVDLARKIPHNAGPKLEVEKERERELREQCNVVVDKGFRPDLVPPSDLVNPTGSDFRSKRLNPHKHFLFETLQRATTDNGENCNYELLISEQDEQRDAGLHSVEQTLVDKVPLGVSGNKANQPKYWNGVSGQPAPTAQDLAALNIPPDSDYEYYGTFAHKNHGRRFVGVDAPNQPLTWEQRKEIPHHRRLYVVGYGPLGKKVETLSKFSDKYQNLRYVFDGPDIPSAPVIMAECVGAVYENQQKLGLHKPFNVFGSAEEDDSEWEDCSDEEMV